MSECMKLIKYLDLEIWTTQKFRISTQLFLLSFFLSPTEGLKLRGVFFCTHLSVFYPVHDFLDVQRFLDHLVVVGELSLRRQLHERFR